MRHSCCRSPEISTDFSRRTQYNDGSYDPHNNNDDDDCDDDDVFSLSCLSLFMFDDVSDKMISPSFCLIVLPLICKSLP